MDIYTDPYVADYMQRFAANMYDYSIKMHDYADKKNEPFTLYRPRLSLDGNQWCALYGDNLQEGVAGFGDSPELAAAAFNEEWKSCWVKDGRNPQDAKGEAK